MHKLHLLLHQEAVEDQVHGAAEAGFPEDSPEGASAAAEVVAGRINLNPSFVHKAYT